MWTWIIGLIGGMALGYLWYRKIAINRMLVILRKLGLPDNYVQQANVYIREYNKITKEAQKKYQEQAMKAEMDFIAKNNPSTKTE